MTHKLTDRRQFLKTSATVTGALAATPYIWTTGDTFAAQNQSKNDRLSVAAIGNGGRGSAVGHQAGRLGDMVACCDVDKNRAAGFAKKYGDKCKTYGDYREVLDRKDIDVGTIGTPDHWHVKIAVEALQSGKDVYCEKPLTLTIDEGKIICRVVKETGRVFQVGTQQRSEYGNKFLKAVAIARSGRLGKKLRATSSVGSARSGGPFKEGSSQTILGVIYAKKSDKGLDLIADATYIDSDGDKIFINAKRTAGDISVGGGGNATQKIIGGTGKYEGVQGVCELLVEYLPDNRTVVRGSCEWERN